MSNQKMTRRQRKRHRNHLQRIRAHRWCRIIAPPVFAVGMLLLVASVFIVFGMLIFWLERTAGFNVFGVLCSILFAGFVIGAGWQIGKDFCDQRS